MFNLLNRIQNTSGLSRLNFKSSSQPAFCRRNILSGDVFETSRKTRTVTIHDIKGRCIDAEITEEDRGGGSKTFTMNSGNTNIGYIDVCRVSNENSLYVSRLQTQPHSMRIFKGAGTELLKCAVRESIKQGFNGRLAFYAANGKDTPFVFYYKNNAALPAGEGRNAVIHYAAVNNIPVIDLLNEPDVQGVMNIDEKGAQALLDGKRLYEDRTIERIAETNIKGVKYNADLIQSPYDGESYLMIKDEDIKNKYGKSSFHNLIVLVLREKVNERGKKYLEISDIQEFRTRRTDKSIIYKALDKIEKLKGFDKTCFSEQLMPQYEDYLPE